MSEKKVAAGLKKLPNYPDLEKFLRSQSLLSLSVSAVCLAFVTGVISGIIHWSIRENFIEAVEAIRNTAFFVLATAAFVIAGFRIELYREKANVEFWVRIWDQLDNSYLEWDEFVGEAVLILNEIKQNVDLSVKTMKGIKRPVDPSGHPVRHNPSYKLAYKKYKNYNWKELQKITDRYVFKLESNFPGMADVAHAVTELLKESQKENEKIMESLVAMKQSSDISEDFKGDVMNFESTIVTVSRMRYAHRKEHHDTRERMTRPGEGRQ